MTYDIIVIILYFFFVTDHTKHPINTDALPFMIDVYVMQNTETPSVRFQFSVTTPLFNIADLKRSMQNTLTSSHQAARFGKILIDDHIIQPFDRIDFLLTLKQCPREARKKRLLKKLKS